MDAAWAQANPGVNRHGSMNWNQVTVKKLVSALESFYGFISTSP